MKFVLVFLSLQVLISNALLEPDEGSDDGSGVSKLTRIVFSKDWKETLHGSLDPGSEVRIEYDASRLPNRDTLYGQRAWNIFAELQYFAGGKVYSVLLDGPDEKEMMRTTLDIPSNATSFIIWFKHYGYYNGFSYDSNYGKNYKFPFTQIVFKGDWRAYVKGALNPGEKFQVVYDSIRLPWRDMGYLGMGYAWNIFARAQFTENGRVVQQMLQGGNQGGNPIMTTIYDIPKDAKEVNLWFYFTGYRHNLKWDSNHGQDYHFPLSN